VEGERINPVCVRASAGRCVHFSPRPFPAGIRPAEPRPHLPAHGPRSATRQIESHPSRPRTRAFPRKARLPDRRGSPWLRPAEGRMPFGRSPPPPSPGSVACRMRTVRGRVTSLRTAIKGDGRGRLRSGSAGGRTSFGRDEDGSPKVSLATSHPRTSRV